MRNPITPGLIALKRSAVESIYVDRMDVSVSEWVPDPVTGIETETYVEIARDVPCRVVTQQIETLQEKPKQFRRMIGVDLNPELVIPPGSKLTIRHYDRVDEYRLSSLPQVYSGHQRVDAECYVEERLWA